MAYELWSQDNFSKGELSPFMYARATVNQYYNGMKTAQNVLTYPTGAAGKRFGTLFQAICNFIPDEKSFFFQTFEYLNECVYQLIFYPLNVAIFLEGLLIKTVTTPYNAQQTFDITNTVLGAIFRVTTDGFKPYDLTRAPSTGNVITGRSGNAFTLTTAVTAGLVLPVRFTNAGGNIPTTTPQIIPDVTYFVNYLTTSTAAVYTSAYNAKFDIDRIVIANPYDGTGTNTLIPQNDWSFANPTFKNLPVYDFNGVAHSYDAITFTPSAVSGNAVTITLDSPYTFLTNAYIGGAFAGNGGVGRITAVTDTSHFKIATEHPFNDTSGILGSLAFLAEPAWSDARGWPQKCSSYQSRCLFANTFSLSNGFWASTINDYFDFNDLQTDDDNAISWFPSSDNVNFIRFIVPYRSITIHTNTGIYSSPLSDVAAITPNNFSLVLQDSTPATVLQPRAIDNQILVVSGNDVHTMLWDGINNAYTSDIVSVVNEQTIRNPVDETPYADLTRAGSRYVFIINDAGSMAVYQTLLSQEVSGFTPQIMQQSYGNAAFRQSASSSDGRAWFVTERDIATAQPGVAITAFSSGTPSTLTAPGILIPTTFATAITFTTTGTLPESSPQINTTQYFWAIGTTGSSFIVYPTQEDAQAGTNPISFTSSGTNSNVVEWITVSTFIIEELNQEVNIDCAVYYNGASVSSVTTGTLFNAQDVVMIGLNSTMVGSAGFGFSAQGFNNQVAFSAHGIPTDVQNAYIGFPINLIIEPMPLSMTTGYSQKNTALTKPKHIRTVRFMFNNTIGGTINGVPIALKPFQMSGIGEPPLPSRGIFEMGIQKGWDDFNNPSYTIEHSEPFNIQLLGVFYSVEV